MRWIRQPARRIAGAALAALLIAPGSAHALKVVTWNLTLYTPTVMPARQPNLRLVLAALSPDVMICQEMDDATTADSVLNNVLNVVEPGQWASSGWVTLGSGEGGAIFYKTAKVAVSNVSSVGTGGPRNVLVGLVKPVGYVATSTQFRLYSVHFKAGNTVSDSTTRRTECTNLRNTLNLAPAGTNLVLGGDTNFYGDYEGGYIRLTESQADNDGRLKDPVPLAGTWNNFSYRLYHSQCPCNTPTCPSGFSGGGLDDRFDFFMTSYGMQDGAGLDFVAGTAFPYGNDGEHYNDNVNGGGFNNAVGLTIANALHDVADHLPAMITIQLPARVAAASQLDFGTVIVDAVPTQTLSVSNPAAAPADILDYTLAAPAGFTAPGGTFHAAAGAAANDHSLGMSAATAGAKNGTLTVASDAPDSASKSVKLSGLVIRHASASLDSEAVTTAAMLDFGDREIGAFTDSSVRVHNQGYDSMQARLEVTGGVILGGGGRFSIVGGFSPATLSGVGNTWNVHFDDTGATLDSTYDAALMFATADEALPGAAAESTLTVTLRARPIQGSVGVGPGGVPTELRFYAPRPNPLSSSVLFAFDLPQDADASLSIFDLGGRRVASLKSGRAPAGRHEVPWNATSDRGGRVPAGLYFVRFSTPGLSRTARLIVLP